MLSNLKEAQANATRRPPFKINSPAKLLSSRLIISSLLRSLNNCSVSSIETTILTALEAAGTAESTRQEKAVHLI